MKVEHVLSIGANLGEGPLWSVDKKLLFWIDIDEPAIHRYDPATGTNEHTRLSEPICALVESTNGGMIASLENSFVQIDPVSGDFETLATPVNDKAMRFNDGACDRRGRYWSGMMWKDFAGMMLKEDYKPVCALFRMKPNLTVEVMDTEISLSNGIGFSPDDSRMYLSDSMQRTVYEFDFNLDDGSIKNKRPLIHVSDKDGFPDGLTVDSEGFIWLCHWDGWKVTRHDPDGQLVATIEMPVPRPTSCAFGGRDLSTMFITSAIMDLDPNERKKGPLSGDLFAVDLPIPGLPEPKFIRA